MSTHETMTIHRALVELKTIDKRIAQEINDATFCLSAKTNSKKLMGQSVEEFIAKADGSYNKINDLIARRNAIKCAIPVSNATTQIKVGDKTMTVAEAIVLKQNGFQPITKLLEEMKDQYSVAVSDSEAENATLDKRADAYVTSLYGSNAAAKAADPADVKSARDTYINANTFEVYDGLKSGKRTIAQTIKTLEDDITKFQNDLDAALSVSNATTTIDITY